MSASEPGKLDPEAFLRLRELGGDELVESVVGAFFSNGPAYMSAIDPRAADLDETERAAHMLKTSAGYVGAGVLRDLAQQAEDEARNGDRAALAGTAVVLAREFVLVETNLDKASREP